MHMSQDEAVVRLAWDLQFYNWKEFRAYYGRAANWHCIICKHHVIINTKQI